MFKRQIKIDLVKPTKKTAEDAPEDALSADDYVNVTKDIVRGVAIGAAFIITDYMIADTVRKILVSRLSK